MSLKMKNKIDRRNFFGKVSMGAIGALLLSSFPMKLFAKGKRKLNRKVFVKIHPNSVKRNK